MEFLDDYELERLRGCARSVPARNQLQLTPAKTRGNLGCFQDISRLALSEQPDKEMYITEPKEEIMALDVQLLQFVDAASKNDVATMERIAAGGLDPK